MVVMDLVPEPWLALVSHLIAVDRPISVTTVDHSDFELPTKKQIENSQLNTLKNYKKFESIG